MRSKKRRKKSLKKKQNKTIVYICIFTVIIIIGIYLFYTKYPKEIFIEDIPKDMYLASNTTTVKIYKLEETNPQEETSQEEPTKTLIEASELPRGNLIKAKSKKVKFEEKEYQLILIENQEYYVEVQNITPTKEEVVLEDNIFVRTSTTILETIESSKINGFATKGEELQVLGYEDLRSNGSVSTYKVKLGEIEGYIYSKYTSLTKEESLKNYQAEIYDPIHSKIKNSYNGGEAIKLDFYPNEKPKFEDNIMPASVYALYLNCGTSTIENIDAYIDFAKTTKINAFVVDIKDNESPAYPAKTFETLSPTNYKHAINSYESYKDAIKKLKDAGFYVIGRITTFKDSYYVTDHPETAITNINTGSPYLHNGSYWPSAYNRDVWYYTISLAKEAVKEFGFNEINFDYVRFPDRMNSVANSVDLKNTYNEDKTEAIQNFVRYATDALHELNVYVSIDVFGETTNGSYTTAYGQYWPAISNVADVISGMPYPDHFAAGSYGIQKPWNNPYQLMHYWGSYASDRQKEIPTPAKVRTWIQAYDVMKYVDQNGISYGAEEVEQEIRGLYEAGLDGGYITWLSNSSLSKYKSQAKAFQIDYGKEYLDE